MGFERTKWVWMNGQFVQWSEATVHASAHTLHYGSGVFEGIRCYETDQGPALFRLEDHLDRLLFSASVYGMSIPYSKDELQDAIDETIARNEFTSCYVRPICYHGSGALSLDPKSCPIEVAILAWPWGKYLGDEAVLAGVRLTLSSWTRFHSSMVPTTAKGCGQYVNSMLAAREAHQRGYDEALMLDLSGNIAEGSGENLFIVRSGRLFTNDERSSILPGITRDSVLRIAANLGIPVSIQAISESDLLQADEAFLTGTAAEISPVAEVDGKQIGDSRPGPMTADIQSRFFGAVTGREPDYHHWLHYVGAAVAESCS
ncbi:MAG: branched-chain amino acid transaminase [Blastocatellia bacterium]